MSDYLKFNSDDSELDAILAEVKNSKQYAEAAEDEPEIGRAHGLNSSHAT